MTAEEFLNFALPKHSTGNPIDMMNDLKRFGIEHEDKGLVEACNRELANLN